MFLNLRRDVSFSTLTYFLVTVVRRLLGYR